MPIGHTPAVQGDDFPVRNRFNMPQATRRNAGPAPQRAKYVALPMGEGGRVVPVDKWEADHVRNYSTADWKAKVQVSDRRNIRPPDKEKLGIKHEAKTANVGGQAKVYANSRWDNVVQVRRDGVDYWHKEVEQLVYNGLGDVPGKGGGEGDGGGGGEGVGGNGSGGANKKGKQGESGAGASRPNGGQGKDAPDNHPYPWVGRADPDQCEWAARAREFKKRSDAGRIAKENKILKQRVVSIQKKEVDIVKKEQTPPTYPTNPRYAAQPPTKRASQQAMRRAVAVASECPKLYSALGGKFGKDQRLQSAKPPSKTRLSEIEGDAPAREVAAVEGVVSDAGSMYRLRGLLRPGARGRRVGGSAGRSACVLRLRGGIRHLVEEGGGASDFASNVTTEVSILVKVPESRLEVLQVVSSGEDSQVTDVYLVVAESIGIDDTNSEGVVAALKAAVASPDSSSSSSSKSSMPILQRALSVDVLEEGREKWDDEGGADGEGVNKGQSIYAKLKKRIIDDVMRLSAFSEDEYVDVCLRIASEELGDDAHDLDGWDSLLSVLREDLGAPDDTISLFQRHLAPLCRAHTQLSSLLRTAASRPKPSNDALLESALRLFIETHRAYPLRAHAESAHAIQQLLAALAPPPTSGLVEPVSERFQRTSKVARLFVDRGGVAGAVERLGRNLLMEAAEGQEEGVRERVVREALEELFDQYPSLQLGGEEGQLEGVAVALIWCLIEEATKAAKAQGKTLSEEDKGEIVLCFVETLLDVAPEADQDPLTHELASMMANLQLSKESQGSVIAIALDYYADLQRRRGD